MTRSNSILVRGEGTVGTSEIANCSGPDGTRTSLPPTTSTPTASIMRDVAVLPFVEKRFRARGFLS